jgi:hypothetical protein
MTLKAVSSTDVGTFERPLNAFRRISVNNKLTGELIKRGKENSDENKSAIEVTNYKTGRSSSRNIRLLISKVDDKE